MNTIRAIALACAMAGAVGTSVAAASTTTPSSTEGLPQVTLTAQAQVKVPTDEMVVVLKIEKEGSNLGALNDAVLTELQDGLAKAKLTTGVHARLGGVHTRQTYTNQGQANGWHVEGSIILDSKKLKDLGDLAGKLSTRLQLNGVSFRLSAERQHELEQSLLKDAAQAFRAKAQASAVALGYSEYVLKEVNISQVAAGGQLPVMMPMYAKAMSASAMSTSAVPQDVGETEVSVTMSGSVGLR